MATKLKIFIYLILSLLLLTGFVFAGFYVEYRIQTSGLSDEVMEEPYTYINSHDKVSFIIIGDSGIGLKIQKKVALQIERACRKRRPEGLIIVGDVVYPAGIESADDPAWVEKVLSVYSGKCLDSVPIFPVPGNHDYHGNMKAWIELSKRYERWKYPSRNYSVVLEDIVTLYALDTVYPINFDKDGIPDFGKATTPWVLAVGHHPIQSGSNAGGEHKGGGLRSLFLKPALCDTVDDFVSGHTHHLEYNPVEGCRMNQHISGGGGGTLYEINKLSDAEFLVSSYGFLEMTYTIDELNFRFFSDTGEVLFEKTRSRSSQQASGQ